MRASRCSLLLALLAAAPFRAFAASYSTHYDPVGEKFYTAGQLGRMAPIAIVIVGFAVAWLVYAIRRKTASLSHENGEPHHC